MSKINLIRSAVINMVAGALGPDFERIPNPYFIEENAGLILRMGFGVAVGAGQIVSGEMCRSHYQRTFNILVTRVTAATDHDMTGHDELEQALLEDFQKIRNALERGDEGLQANCNRADYESDTGIQFLLGEQFKFCSIGINISTQYTEQVT